MVLDVEDQAVEGFCKIFVTRDGNRYEVLRKYMQRPLSQTELQRLKNHENSVAKRKAEQAMPAIMTDAEIEAGNLDAFYCTLSDAGITGIIGHHDDYEGGGRFEDKRAVCGQKLMDLPTLEVQHAQKDARGRQGHASQKAIRQVLYEVLDDILSNIQVGYYFSHGTFFSFAAMWQRAKFISKPVDVILTMSFWNWTLFADNKFLNELCLTQPRRPFLNSLSAAYSVGLSNFENRCFFPLSTLHAKRNGKWTKRKRPANANGRPAPRQNSPSMRSNCSRAKG